MHRRPQDDEKKIKKPLPQVQEDPNASLSVDFVPPKPDEEDEDVKDQQISQEEQERRDREAFEKAKRDRSVPKPKEDSDLLKRNRDRRAADVLKRPDIDPRKGKK